MSQGLIELAATELDLVVAGRASSSTIIIEPVIQLTLNLELFSNDALAISFGGSSLAIAGNSYQLGTAVAQITARLRR